MIFVCLGSQQYQFNRLLKKLDELKETGKIRQEIFAQIGNSTYFPRCYEWKRFIPQEEYLDKVQKADIVIAHGGTGAIIKALNAKKQVIAIPRQAKYGEHADNHQFQIVDFMYDNGYIRKVVEMEELESAIHAAEVKPITKVFKGNGHVRELIENFIDAI